MASNPSTLWFWNDWVFDANLRMCSMAAQGFWMQMLAIAAAATPRGYVRIGDKPCSIDKLAHLTGQDKRNVNRWVRELEQNGVASRDHLGLFCRRMAREDLQGIRHDSARARASLASDSDSTPPKSPPPGGDRSKMNGKVAKEPSFGPLQDPVDIARKLGIRK